MDFIFIIFYLIAFLLIVYQPINAVYIAMIDSLLPVRYYEQAFGIPFSIFFLMGVLVSIQFRDRTPILKIFGPIKLLLIIILYLFGSNYSYFKSFDISILNNFALLFLIQSTVQMYRLNDYWGGLLKCSVVVGIILSTDIILKLGVFGNLRHIGFYLIIIIACIYAGKISGLKSHLFSFFFIALFFVAIVLSEGRLNLAIAILILIIGYGQMKNFSKLRLYFVGILGGLVVLAIFSFVGLGYFTRNTTTIENIKFNSNDQDLGAFTSGRSIIYENAWDMFLSSPITGNGYKSFNALDNKFNNFHSFGASQKISMHSVFLQYLSETGVIGFCMYYLLLYLVFRRGKKLLKKDKIQIANVLLLRSYGFLLFTLPIIMFLGSLFDNHGIHYKHIFILLAILPFVLAEFENTSNNRHYIQEV